MPRIKPKPAAAPAAVPQPAPDPAEIERQNQALAEASATLFGDAGPPRDRGSARAAALEAQRPLFQERDVPAARGEHPQRPAPLVHPPVPSGRTAGREVLSGNHRVQAAVEAGVPVILVLTILQDLSKSEQIAIQLSHNALVGQDDQGILAALWADIEELEAKLYAGLSSEALKEIKEVKLVTLSTPHVATKSRRLRLHRVRAGVPGRGFGRARPRARRRRLPVPDRPVQRSSSRSSRA